MKGGDEVKKTAEILAIESGRLTESIVVEPRPLRNQTKAYLQ
jgi:hypothetical protein